MNTAIESIKEICRKTKILNEWSFEICGEKILVANYKPYKKWKGDIHNFGSNTDYQFSQYEPIIERLQAYVYQYFYSTGTTEPDLPLLEKYGSFIEHPEEQHRFMMHLSENNNSINRYDLCWKVLDIFQDRILVSKNDQSKEVLQGAYIGAHGNTQSEINQLLSVYNKKEDMYLQPYFYYVYGNDQPGAQAELIRFYFNIIPSEVHRLINQLTSLFNKYELPFSFKCLNHHDYYNCRADAAVLYLEKKYHNIAWRLIKKTYDQLASHFLPETPLFTYEILPGLAFAENPGKNMSFGMTKVDAISQVIMTEYSQQKQCTSEEIEDVLALNGTDIDKTYLNINSGINYPFVKD